MEQGSIIEQNFQVKKQFQRKLPYFFAVTVSYALLCIYLFLH